MNFCQHHLNKIYARIIIGFLLKILQTPNINVVKKKNLEISLNFSIKLAISCIKQRLLWWWLLVEVEGLVWPNDSESDAVGSFKLLVGPY